MKEQGKQTKGLFFSEWWWNHFVAEWNAFPERTRLAGLGQVIFRLTGEGRPKEVSLFWDETGNVSRHTQAADLIKLSATKENWRAFIHGEFKATEGVLSERIKFEGKVGRITPYSLDFDLFSSVAVKVYPDW